MTLKIYNKLVRDRIPAILSEKGIRFSSHIANQEEYKEALRKKLAEEVEEYKENPTIEELADILEVVYAIATADNSSFEKLETYRKSKLTERGGFMRRIILENTEE